MMRIPSRAVSFATALLLCGTALCQEDVATREALATAFREALEGNDEALWTESGRALRARIAKALDDSLNGAAVLYCSPDGLLATVPLGLLPDGEGDKPRFLIERCAIRHVHGRAGLVIASKLPPPTGVGLLAIGDVDYDEAEGATGEGRPADQPVVALMETGQEANAVRDWFRAAALRALPESMSHLNRAVELDPSAPAARTKRGIASRAMGEVRAALAVIYRKLGRPAEALADIEVAKTLSGGEANVDRLIEALRKEAGGQ